MMSLGDKFSKDTVQDFQNWEEYGYDDIPDYKTEYKNYINTEKVPEKPIAEEIPDFREELKRQCRFWTCRRTSITSSISSSTR
jgi:RNA polymerase sigma-54 factor